MAKRAVPEERSSPHKVTGFRLDPVLVKKLKILALKKDTQTYKLLEEAITDLLKKYREI